MMMTTNDDNDDELHGNAEWEGTRYPRTGGMGENTPFPNNIGKKSVNDAGPQQGHNNDDDAKRHWDSDDVLMTLWLLSLMTLSLY